MSTGFEVLQEGVHGSVRFRRGPATHDSKKKMRQLPSWGGEEGACQAKIYTSCNTAAKERDPNRIELLET